MNNFPPNISCFYIPTINNSDIIYLSEEETKHAIKVLRLRKYDNILISDGKGNLYIASIQDTKFKNVLLKIQEQKVIPPPPYHLHIAISLLHHINRFEWFIEKAVELGISQITPLLCHYTVKKRINEERLKKIAIAALKQSRSAYLPKINQLTKFNEFVIKENTCHKAIATCNTKGISLNQFISQSKDNTYTILIGPEGDFNHNEVEIAIKNKYSIINLGNSTLRSETAALYVTASMKYFFSNY